MKKLICLILLFSKICLADVTAKNTIVPSGINHKLHIQHNSDKTALAFKSCKFGKNKEEVCTQLGLQTFYGIDQIIGQFIRDTKELSDAIMVDGLIIYSHGALIATFGFASGLLIAMAGDNMLAIIADHRERGPVDKAVTDLINPVDNWEHLSIFSQALITDADILMKEPREVHDFILTLESVLKSIPIREVYKPKMNNSGKLGRPLIN